MKKIRSINLLVFIAFMLSISVGVYAQEEDRPDFSLIEYKSGQQQSFKDILTTRVNIMVVTSTTCGSCISELKAMDWIRAKYKGDLSVTAVFIDRGGELRVYRYLEYYKFDLERFLVDPGGAVPSRFNAPTVPTMIMFDKKGNERFRKVGFSAGDESLIIAQAEEIMFGKKPDTGRPSTGLGTGRTQDAVKTDDTAQGVPDVRKTTGCASTG
ncbi:MAG: TlpA disulfide reductase family protein [bacterium]|nr:TlpA disulfide reductase family protein [bacterium]